LRLSERSENQRFHFRTKAISTKGQDTGKIKGYQPALKQERAHIFTIMGSFFGVLPFSL
jgi:hypothetical protein